MGGGVNPRKQPTRQQQKKHREENTPLSQQRFLVVYLKFNPTSCILFGNPRQCGLGHSRWDPGPAPREPGRGRFTRQALLPALLPALGRQESRSPGPCRQPGEPIVPRALQAWSGDRAPSSIVREWGWHLGPCCARPGRVVIGLSGRALSSPRGVGGRLCAVRSPGWGLDDGRVSSCPASVSSSAGGAQHNSCTCCMGTGGTPGPCPLGPHGSAFLRPGHAQECGRCV